ncbi:transposase [Calothrix sp. NIES-2100]|nr:transposase [Calothrix sp. NIES-2100]
MPDASDIVDVIAGEPGPKSDITLFRENRDNFDTKQKFQGDLGYLGEDLIDTPIKTPRNRKLTSDPKQENQQFSSKRVFVEHRIRSVKIFRVVQERFRLNPQKYAEVILTICGESALREGFPLQATANPKGLVRLRIGALILPTKIAPLPSG